MLAACITVPPPRPASPVIHAASGTPIPQAEKSPANIAGIGVERPARPLQCVSYVQSHSAVAIRGDAWTWWRQARGRYTRSHQPSVDAVMVFSRDRRSWSGHVAVVGAVISAREIRIDHANWLGRGRIYLGDPVMDVSAASDWSQVKVWESDTGRWGIHKYLISGFVGPEPAQVASTGLDYQKKSCFINMLNEVLRHSATPLFCALAGRA